VGRITRKPAKGTVKTKRRRVCTGVRDGLGGSRHNLGECTAELAVDITVVLPNAVDGETHAEVPI